MNTIKEQSGYIALIALLIVASVALSIGLALSLSSIDQIQLSYAASQAAQAKSMATACLEDGLEQLRKNWGVVSAGLSINQNSCILSTTIQGNQASLTSIGTASTYSQKIKITVDTSLEVVNWQEY